MLRTAAFLAGLAASAVLLDACAWFEPVPAAEIPTIEIPALALSPGASKGPLIIVLPGRGDDVRDLRDSGIAALIQRHIPDARVMLVDDRLQYYRDGGQVPRLQSQIVEPALRSGTREIWMAGTSLGGFGSLLYEYEHPGVLAGIVLLAPFTGDASLTKAVAAAGGPAQWNGGGEAGPPRDFDAAGRAIWRLVKTWGQDPGRADRVWLGCGRDDRFIRAARLMATQLPASHYAEVAGSHEWKSWTRAADALFARIEAERLQAQPAPAAR